MKALLFGSIGSLVDTSHLQWEAYNTAFADTGSTWRWTREAYERLLAEPGGQQRLFRHAEREGLAPPDANWVGAVHARKTELFESLMEERSPPPRPGVRRVLKAARSDGLAIGLVTSTERSNVHHTLAALGEGFGEDRFDVVTHRALVDAPKPDPAVWHLALERLGIGAHEAIAIEDTGACVDTAVAAGLFTIATPNAFAGGQDFRAAHSIVDCMGDRSCASRQLAGAAIVADGVVSLDLLAQRLAAPA